MKKQKKCHPFIEQHYQHYVARCPACGWSGAYQPDTAHAVQDYAMNHAPPVCECGHWRAMDRKGRDGLNVDDETIAS